MAEALLGLAPAYIDAPGKKPSIAHPDDLPAQLRRDLETRKTPTRCEHVSATLEVPSTVEFAVQEADGNAQENIDPDLGGVGIQVAESQPVKTVRVYETIISQPHDNPAKQRAVAKHIVGLLSTVDESTWVVREVSRGQYGWTFTYVCKDSVAMWNRQNGKAASKALIGEYSKKELEPVISALADDLPGRPAFDCRGTLTIAFSTNSRSIVVKYEHTPFHKTVGEMIEYFRPLPSAAPPASLIPAGDKPKKTKTPRKRKSEANGDGTPSQPKKRKKESEAAASGDGAEDGAVSNGPTTTTVPTKADAVVQSGVHSQTVLNVPSAEAARRREVAIRLLTDSGVDSESLSPEQFSIFANQSPDLQKESLSMLAKYGAERLRIVHPSDAATASSTSASPVPLQVTVQAEPGEPGATLESPASGKKQRSRRSTVAVGDVEEEELTPAPAGTPLRQVSRGSCIACRKAKAKCNRAKPTCSHCEAQHTECQYPLVRKQAPKKKEDKSPAQVEDGDDGAEAELEREPQSAAEPEVEAEQSGADDINTIDYTSSMPVANMITPAAVDPGQDYFESGPGELSYTQDASNGLNKPYGVSSYPEPPTAVRCTEQHAVTTSYAQTSLTDMAAYTPPAANTTNYVEPTSTNNVGYQQQAAASSYDYAQSAVKGSWTTDISTSRKDLLSEQLQHPIAGSPAPLPGHEQNWQSMSPPKPTNTVSPTMTTWQRRPRKSAQEPVPTTAVQQQTSYDNSQQTTAHAAMHQQQQRQEHQTSPTQQMAQAALVPQTVTPAQASPFQAPAQSSRTQSRAGHRASTRTPVNDPQATPSHRTVQPPTQETMETTAYSKVHSMSNVANYSKFNTKHSHASNNTTNAGTSLARQPYAAQNTSASTSAYPPYHHDKGNAASQNTGLSYIPSNNSRSGQLYDTQSQLRNTQSYGNIVGANTSTTNIYTQPSSTAQQQASSVQSFSMQASTTTSPTRSLTRHNNQQKQQQQQQQPQQPQQSQSYGSYPSQMQQHSTQQDQHSWYGFGPGTNTSFTPANASGGYASRGSAPANHEPDSNSVGQAYQQQQQHGSLAMSSHNYAGADHDMYELLKYSIHSPGS